MNPQAWPLPALRRFRRHTDVRLVLPVYYGRNESRKRYERRRVFELYGLWLLADELFGAMALLSVAAGAWALLWAVT